MAEHIIDQSFSIGQSKEDIFDFFASAENLERLTPPWLNFKIISSLPINMDVGTVIEYEIKLHGIPIRWESEITLWDPPHRFCDIQRKGPYKKWVHEHIFETSDVGTLVKDKVNYEVIGGNLINKLFVKNDLAKIFNYRQATLLTIFNDECEKS